MTQGRLGAGRGFREKATMTSLAPAANPDAHAATWAATRDVTRLSVGVAVVLIALKAFALGASGSVSILATLADSALDLVASLGVFFAVRWAALPADEGHHDGGRNSGEAVAALVQAGLVFAAALFVGWEAVQRIFDPRPIASGYWSVLVVLISIALTGWLVWRQGRAIRQTGSFAVKADRSHYAADLGANVVVLIGVISGAWLAAPGLDAAAGLVIAVWLFWGGLTLLRTAADHLVDKALPEADRVVITTAVLSDPRISNVSQLRTRLAGQTVMIRMRVDLDPSLTLEDTRAILGEAESRLLAGFPRADILIHPDPRAGAASPDPAPAKEVG